MSQSLNGCADVLVVAARSTAAIDNFAIVNIVESILMLMYYCYVIVMKL